MECRLIVTKELFGRYNIRHCPEYSRTDLLSFRAVMRDLRIFEGMKQSRKIFETEPILTSLSQLECDYGQNFRTYLLEKIVEKSV